LSLGKVRGRDTLWRKKRYSFMPRPASHLDGYLSSVNRWLLSQVAPPRLPLSGRSRRTSRVPTRTRSSSIAPHQGREVWILLDEVACESCCRSATVAA